LVPDFGKIWQDFASPVSAVYQAFSLSSILETGVFRIDLDMIDLIRRLYMMRNFLALLSGLLGVVVAAVAIPRRVNGQAEIPTEKLVIALRLLNTEEYSYRNETGRFASLEEMLTFSERNAA
jgi:hypothetical protein